MCSHPRIKRPPEPVPNHRRVYHPPMRRTDWLLRLVFVVVSVLLLWAAEDRFEVVQNQFRLPRTRPHVLSAMLVYIAIAVLAGLAFGLAMRPPHGWSYRWGIALILGAVPFVLLAVTVWIEGYQYTRGPIPSFLFHPGFYLNWGPQFALAVMPGLAIAAGFTPTQEATTADPNSSPPGDVESLTRERDLNERTAP